MADRESRDADVALSAKALVALVATVMLALAVVAGLIALSGGPVARPASTLPDQAPDFPAPALRTDPLAEPAALAREKAPALDGIEEAMRRLESGGWPSEEAR
ncbi:MAG: hypothetical protein ACM33T_10435 [Solirubrobacterales bacterium]